MEPATPNGGLATYRDMISAIATVEARQDARDAQFTGQLGELKVEMAGMTGRVSGMGRELGEVKTEIQRYGGRPSWMVTFVLGLLGSVCVGLVTAMVVRA